MSLPTVTLTGTFLTGEGPATGEVALYLTSPMVDAADNVIVPVTKIVLPLNAAGKFSTTIVPSDAAGLAPNPVPYQVVERIAGGAPRRYQVVVPSGSGTVDLSTLAPLTADILPPSAYSLLASLITIEAGARAVADTALSSSLASEASTRASADTTNAGAITTEAGTRATADTTNANAIAAEAISRASADATKVAKNGDTMSGDLAMGSHRVTGLADPSASQDAATKAWTSAQVTALINGAPGILDTLGEIATQLQTDESAAAALTTALATETTNRTSADTLATQKAANGSDFADAGTTRANLRVPVLTPAQVVATSNQALTGQPTIDGYATTNGDVVLLTAQTTASQNGPWQLPASGTGAWARPKDFPSGAVVKGRSCKVVGGTLYAGTDWALMALTTVTVDTTAQTWKMVGGGAYQPLNPVALKAALGDPTLVPAGTLRTTAGDAADGGGAVYVAAGSPQTWQQTSGQVNASATTELGFADLSTAITGLTATSYTDLGLATSYTQASAPVLIKFFAPQIYSSTAGTQVFFQLLIDGTTAVGSDTVICTLAVGSGGLYRAMIEHRPNPSLAAGLHAIKVQYKVSANSGNVNASSSVRPYLRVTA